MSHFASRSTRAGVLAIAAAAAGLVLTGCSGSSASSAASTPGPGAATTAAATATAAGSSTGTVAYFPVALGDTWSYTSHLGSDQGTVHDQVVSVAGTAGGTEATVKVTDVVAGQTVTSTSVFVVHPDGSISVPANYAGSAFKLVSGGLVWPSAAELAAGQPHYATLLMKSAAGGQDVTAHAVIKGLGTQTVTVPAGTYSAMVVDEQMTEEVSGVSSVLDLRTWLANGVGPVKQTLNDTDGGTQTVSYVQELTSFTKG